MSVTIIGLDIAQKTTVLEPQPMDTLFVCSEDFA
jgi:hypothetical protein